MKVPTVLPIEGYTDVYAVQKEAELLWLIQEMFLHDVRSLLSIGLHQGGTEWHIARKYTEAGKMISLSGVDLVDCKALQNNRQEIEQRFRQPFRFYHTSSHDPDLPRQLQPSYDAVLIDGDHAYAAAKKDFALARPLAKKMIIFHDIVDSAYHRQAGCYVADLWQELKQEYHTAEMKGNDWAGMGIIYMSSV